MRPLRLDAVIAVVVGVNGCAWGDKFVSVSMHRPSDGAGAICSDTYAVTLGPFYDENALSNYVARCIAACQKLGFVIEAGPFMSTTPEVMANRPEIAKFSNAPAEACPLQKKA
ncbi:hypothetical protein RB623_15755 [Mesorhizobium sp. LHD-90]|uniref:hypothetical protein n=1 Tax=Mesorhizobium sp. LHD-90 TaxID=3071414 RepID=UPI0027E1C5BB|nr:hypothetical protein [Mesorhizobium sp. LHD-90]MDQ6435513.1 hypothetical protein [Mesorhizobium sp. LHD-90]